MISLRLEGVSHVYQPGNVRALEDVNLSIDPGELVALVGQNGSGKSTLVRHLNGLLRPSEGRVVVDGEDAARRTVAQLSRQVGLVFQDPDRQIFAGSVRSEVEFGPRNLGVKGPELARAVEDALESVGLAGEAETNPSDLGETRRRLLSLCAVLAMQTPVLVLDEPTTGLDARGLDQVARLIAATNGESRTVIAISHDMRFVAENFQRVVVMGAGRVLLDGSVAEVFAQENWPALSSTDLEPPLATRVGAHLGLGSTPTNRDLIAALTNRPA